VPKVTEISYRETSGPLSPDSAWDEEHAVSPVGTTFVRTGDSALTTVNTGTWRINSDGVNEAKLFSDLSGTDVYSVKKNGRGATIGAGIREYTVRYDNGDIRSVVLGDGSTYNDPGLITTPINDYIATLVLPAAAQSRYRATI
jgi:hypothetical protein